MTGRPPQKQRNPVRGAALAALFLVSWWFFAAPGGAVRARDGAAPENPPAAGEGGAAETVSPTAAAEALFQKGMEYHERGDFQKAAELYRMAAELDPAQGRHHAYLGEALRRLGPEFRRLAIESLTRGLELDPSLSIAFTNLGVVYDDSQMYALAVANHRKAIETDPSNHYARFNLASSYDKMGLTGAAERNYLLTLEQAPGFAPAHNGLGIIRLKSRKVEEAIGLFKKAIDRALANPEFADGLPTYYNDLASAYAWIQRFDLAREAYQKAIETAPPDMPGLGIVKDNLKFIEENYSP